MNPTLPLLEFFTTTYLPMRLLGAAKGTIQQYTIAIGMLDKFLGRPATVADLNCNTVVAFMQHEQQRGMAVATINARLTHLFALARLVRQRGLFDADLSDVRKLKEKRPAPQAWTEEEMARLVESCRLARGRFLGVPCGAWWQSLVLLTYDTGLRRSAAVAVRFDEIDFATGMLRVPAERMKNGVEQYFRLHSQTIEAILATLPPKRKQVFPWPFTHQRALYGRFRVILRRAGLPFGKKDLFHKIRRTTASHTARVLGEGIASQQLGHQDPTTIKRYVDPRFTSRHDAADFLPRPGWQNPRDIIVKVDSTPPAMGESKTLKYSAADLRGDGEDVFERLKRNGLLTGEDVNAALDAMGMHAKELADEIGVEHRSFARMLRGKKPLAVHLGSQIRTALGISMRAEKEGVA